MICQRSFEPAFFLFGGTEVDDPGIHPACVKRRDRTRVRSDVPYLGGHHDRGDEQRRRSIFARSIGVIAAKPMMGTFRDHFERRGFALTQAAKSGDLDAISHGCSESREAAAGCGSISAVFFMRCLCHFRSDLLDSKPDVIGPDLCGARTRSVWCARSKW